MLLCDLADSEHQLIYSEETGERFSVEYFLDHVQKIDRNMPEYRNILLRKHINDRLIETDCEGFLHVDTYLRNGIWRVQALLIARIENSWDGPSNFCAILNRVFKSGHYAGEVMSIIGPDDKGNAQGGAWAGVLANYNIPFKD